MIWSFNGPAIFLQIHVVTLSDGRNCFGNQMEKPSDTIHNQDPNKISGPGEQGSPGCQSGSGCQGGQGSAANHIPNPTLPRNRCCPYDFDSKLCQVVNDRLLCGYNRNVGRPASNDVSLSGGCRLRGGRLECGYVHGPFTNARRPPGWDDVHNEEWDDDQIIVGDGSLPNIQPSSEEIDRQLFKVIKNKPEKLLLELTIPPQKNMDSTKKHRSTTRCVEIRDRVVCKKV